MNKNSTVALANQLLKDGEFEQALSIYETLSKNNSLWAKVLSTNIRSCKTKIKDVSEFQGFGVVRHNPLISVIIVSYNSGVDLNVLLPSLKAQTYQNFELIVLENGIEETKNICEKYFDSFTYLKEDNIGFAAGNNVCYEHSNGEFIALINPDTRLENNYLQELLDVIRYDEHVAIVAPKIYFYEKFVSIKIEGDEEFSIDISGLIASLSYKKYFVRSGIENDAGLSSDENNSIKIDISHPLKDLIIPVGFKAKSIPSRLKISIGYKTEWVYLKSIDGFEKLNLIFNKESFGSASYLINNAGSGLRNDGQPFDRGFGEYEEGNYLSKTYLSAFCGCAVLIRKIAIVNRKIFIDEYFAYYEDSELSWWINQKKYKIMYCPTAIVYHRHSESTEEKSAVWNCFVSRSYKLYSMITSQSYEQKHKTFCGDYEKLGNSSLENKLRLLDNSISQIGIYEKLIQTNKVTICIYNSYFSSMGGGEKHALDIAQLLKDNCVVYLASEVDFDISNLQKYFGINLDNCIKLISTRIDTYFTSNFDVFINSTFQSNLDSAAKKSFYIVSFPHKHIDTKILSKYHFLHNSPFTSRWAHEYWGNHKSSQVLPIIAFAGQKVEKNINKKKLILSVGRLTFEGHCKNHHLIIQAFKLAVDKKHLDETWELVIAGSCDFSNKSAIDYYHLLLELSDGYNVRVCINIEREALDDLYESSFIYIHATGLNVSPDQPEYHEHFGITPFEAMLNGCYPIVYHLGGPAEQVINLIHSQIYSSLDTLVESIHKVCKKYTNNQEIPKLVCRFSMDIANQNVINSLKILQSSVTI
jgi:GT2 family glycosyltransferase